MKEQEHNNVTDQGWAAMQQLLDQRMPRRRRRVAGWWWFAGLLLLPVAGFVAWQVYEQGNSGIEVPAVPVSRVEPLAVQGAAQTPEKMAGAAQVLPVVATPFEESSSPLSTSANQQASALRPGVKTRQQAILQEQLPKRRKFGTQDFATSTISLSELPPASEPLEPGLPAENKKQEMGLAPLPMAFQILEGELTVQLPPSYPPYYGEEIKPAHRKSSWAFGLAMGLNSERIPRVNGGLVGLTADWQPFRHWGLRTGVQYAMQRLAADESLVTTIAQDDYEKSSNSLSLFDQSGTYGNLGSFSSINTSILASVRRIHRVEMPMSVYWQRKTAFRIYAGASLNYTFLAQTSNRIFSDNQVFKVVSGRDEINRLAIDQIQRWQVKWQGGVGYRFRNIELSASAQTTFPKISFKKSPSIKGELDNVSQSKSEPFMQVRQLGVTLGGVRYF